MDENAAPALHDTMMGGGRMSSVKSMGGNGAGGLAGGSRVPFGVASKENAALNKPAPLGAGASGKLQQQQQQQPVVAPRRALGDITNKGSSAPAGQGSAALQLKKPLQAAQQRPPQPTGLGSKPSGAASSTATLPGAAPLHKQSAAAAPAPLAAASVAARAAATRAAVPDSLPPPERPAGKGWEELEAERRRREEQAVQRRVNLCCAALATSLQDCWIPDDGLAASLVRRLPQARQGPLMAPGGRGAANASAFRASIVRRTSPWWHTRLPLRRPAHCTASWSARCTASAARRRRSAQEQVGCPPRCRGHGATCDGDLPQSPHQGHGLLACLLYVHTDDDDLLLLPDSPLARRVPDLGVPTLQQRS